MLQFFKDSLKNFDYPSKDDFFYLFSKLDMATQSLSQIYGVIDNYKSQGELGKLIVDMDSSLSEEL